MNQVIFKSAEIMSRLPKQTEFVVFIQKTPVATLHCSSQQTLQRHTEIVSPGLSEIYNPDLLDPEEKEHLVKVFDSDKDIHSDINRFIRSGNHLDKVRAEEQYIKMGRKSQFKQKTV